MRQDLNIISPKVILWLCIKILIYLLIYTYTYKKVQYKGNVKMHKRLQKSILTLNLFNELFMLCHSVTFKKKRG